MSDKANESGPRSDRIDELAVDPAEGVEERLQSDSEVLRALAAAVGRNEQLQERFRNAVVRRLARLEARARVLQLSDIVNSLKFGPVDKAVEREEGIEAMVAELSEEIERRMFKEISGRQGERGEAYARRGRLRKWAGWEI